jgi:Holliday junction resolvase RusA-like endonuclease
MGPSIHLPFPPSANRLFTNKYRGGRVRSREYKSWIEMAGKELMRQRPKRHEGPVSITIIASPPHARKRDLDNLLKAALDLLVSHGVIVDDNTDYLKTLSISLGNADPGLDVTVTAA